MRWIRNMAFAAVVSAPQLCLADVLDGFVGQHTFDKVNGRTIYQVAKVRQSMEKLLGKKRAQLVRSFGADAGEIEALEDPQLGRLIFVFQCQVHNCPEQATLYLRPDGEVIAACIAQWTERQGQMTEWIGQGWRTTSKEDCSDGGCCSGADRDELARLNAAKMRAQGGQGR
jgi:hypothetical protein